MKDKLFTPLNIGAFDLPHRIAIDWSPAHGPHHVAFHEPMWSDDLAGGMTIYEPPFLSQGGRARQTADERRHLVARWGALTQYGRASRRSMIARLAVGSSSRGGKASQIRACIDAAHLALAAGFDGVELDGTVTAAGDQRSSRALRYTNGGNRGVTSQAVNRLVEVVDSLTQVIGRDRIGVRLSPFLPSAVSQTELSVHAESLQWLNEREVAYLHLVDSEWDGRRLNGIAVESSSAQAVRRAYRGIMLVSCDFDLSYAIDLVGSRWADGICFLGSKLESKDKEDIARALGTGTG